MSNKARRIGLWALQIAAAGLFLVAGGSKLAGADAYATSKQCNLATAMVFARETPRERHDGRRP